MNEEQQKALELALVSLDRELGKGSVYRFGNGNIEPWPSISTGALTLDVALGIGGLPRGRIVEIFGSEGTGKSTLSLNVIAAAQKQGLTCLYVDAEHSLDPGYAKILGVNLDDLLLSQPDYGEAALQIVDKLVSTGEIGVVVVDSVANLVPKAELEGHIGDSHVGQLPRLMSQAMRILTGKVAQTSTLLIFTNQIREKIGIMWGNPETTPGGRSLKFYSSVRLDLRKKEDLKGSEGEKSGIRVKCNVVKNKMAPPYRLAEYDIVYGRGIDQMGCVVDLATSTGILTMRAGRYYYNDSMVGHGKARVIETLASDLEFLDRLKGLILGN